MKSRSLLAPLLLFLLCLGAYFNTLGNGFHWEDEVLVEKNIHIRSVKNLPAFFRPGYINVYEYSQGLRYRPLRTVSFMADYLVWGGNPLGYHLTNILLHFVSALLLWLLLLASGLGAPGALFAAALFAVHPIHAESVGYVKNRSDLICAVFFLGSLWLWARFLDGGRKADYWLSVLAAALALLAKEMALALPLLAAGLYLLKKPDWRERGVRGALALLPYFALIAGYWVFKATALGGTAAAYSGSLADRVWLIVRTCGSYLKLLVFPLKLSADHAFPLIGYPDLASLIFFLVFSSLFGYFLVKKDWQAAFWTGAFWISLAPVSNLMFIAGRSFAEQRVYIPSAAFCALAGLLAGRAYEAYVSRRAQIAAAAGLVLILFAGRTAARNSDWKDEISLWTRTIATDPSPRAYYNLSVSLYRRADYSRALEAALKGIELGPDIPDGYNTLGAIYMKLQLYPQAIQAFENCLKYSSGREYYAMANLASLYAMTGRQTEALALNYKVIEAAPWFDAAYYNLALSLEKVGRVADAELALRDAIALNPYNVEAHMHLGQILERTRRKVEAGEIYRRLLSRRPDYAPAKARLDALPLP